MKLFKSFCRNISTVLCLLFFKFGYYMMIIQLTNDLISKILNSSASYNIEYIFITMVFKMSCNNFLGNMICNGVLYFVRGRCYNFCKNICFSTSLVVNEMFLLFGGEKSKRRQSKVAQSPEVVQLPHDAIQPSQATPQTGQTKLIFFDQQLSEMFYFLHILHFLLTICLPYFVFNVR